MVTDMSLRLLDLEDKVITDSGAVVAKHNLLTKLALSGQPIANIPYVPHNDVRLYHKRMGTTKTALEWREDDTVNGPNHNSFLWKTPEPYASMDIIEICENKLIGRKLYSDDYINRLEKELILIEKREMKDLFRCMIWITDVFRKENITWGLGRGSSCACLVLYLLGVNKVDPVKYDIPIEDFFKEKN